MRKSKQIRRTNLQLFVEKNKKNGRLNKDLANDIGVSESMFSALRAGRKIIGDKLAARIETALGMSEGSLDKEVKGEEKPVHPDCPLLERLVTIKEWLSGDACDSAERYLCPVSSGERTFITIVSDPSMEPVFSPEEWVFVDPFKQWREATEKEKIYVLASDNGSCLVRRVWKTGNDRYVFSPNVSPWLTLEDESLVIGRIVFRGSPI